LSVLQYVVIVTSNPFRLPGD